jgi:EAL domain-containing protein (putative c-di-GMP-specific phosphodiesterase class I)/GGDEF domain-containing protein
MLTLLQGQSTKEETEEQALLQDIIREQRINPYFQPIMDLNSGEILAYEVLSRCEEPFANPAHMFACAREWGLSWDLEHACRTSALETITEFMPEMKNMLFFLNVSPYIFNDPRFVSGTTVATLRNLGINSRNIVFEITETASVNDYQKFEGLIRYYKNQGFQVALDDFGAGHSGLVTLVAMTPHFLKIDMALVQGINSSAYKQKLVRAIVSFAREVDAACIAEGIEYFGDLETLHRLGVQYGQGFFIGRPAPCPAEPDPVMLEGLHRMILRKNKWRFAVDVSLSGMVVKPKAFCLEEITCEDLDLIFHKDPDLDHVVILAKEKPHCLIPRRHFYSVIGGRYGYSLFQRKFSETIGKTEMLCLNEHTDLRTTGRLAMDRKQEDLYDPVVITGNDGEFVGTITMKQVINKAFDMEIRIATCSNPLTQLPGNLIIGFWLEEAVRSPEFSIVYCDLDNFKAYNDSYGFSCGDEALKLTARILNEFIQERFPMARLGHIGGDDFIIVSEKRVEEQLLEELCSAFDQARTQLFSEQDMERGWYETTNRKGEKVRVPLVSLSLAVVTRANFSDDIHPGQLSQTAAMIKNRVKSRNIKKGGSGYLIDRRRQCES